MIVGIIWLYSYHDLREQYSKYQYQVSPLELSYMHVCFAYT